MKTLCMLPLLLAPVAGYGQAGLFQQAPIGDIAPIKTHGADAGIRKGFQLAFSTLFFPDRVKNEWPVYGYEISNIKSKLCSDQSVYGETFAVKIAALVRPRRDLSEDADLYLGVPIRPTEGGEITGSMEEICIGIKQSDLGRKLHIYDVIDLPSGTWKKIENPPSEEAIPLLSGTLTTDDISEQNYSMVWTLESLELGNPKVRWKKYDHPRPDGHGQPWDTVWGYVPDGGTLEDITYYLAKTGGNSQNEDGSQGRIAISSSWAGEFGMEDISDFTLDSHYSIWYPLEESQQSVESLQSFVDDWYFVTDEPLPRAEIDVRIDPFE